MSNGEPAEQQDRDIRKKRNSEGERRTNLKECQEGRAGDLHHVRITGAVAVDTHNRKADIESREGGAEAKEIKDRTEKHAERRRNTNKHPPVVYVRLGTSSKRLPLLA